MKKMPKEIVLKDIEENHNHSWFREIYLRNKDNLEKIAMTFRGTKITYGEMITSIEKDFAPALKKYGLKKGDDFVCCIRQTPDYPILFGAASLTGSKALFVNEAFDKDYLVKLINESTSSVAFVSDWDFVTLMPVLDKVDKTKKIVIVPTERWDKHNNPYSKITDRFFKFDKKAFEEAKAKYDNIIELDTFLEKGKEYQGEIDGHGKLDDPVAVTFTSGSTSKGVHKGVVQRNQTYIVMGRYHDPEVAGIPKMDKTISYACGPTNADTVLLTGVSDTLMQGGIVALDPIIDEYYFPYALAINNAGLAIATRSYWIRAMKEWKTNPDLKGVKLPGLYVPSEGGEPLSAGEEKALNKWLKKVKAGVDITHTPTSIVKMTVGGGDSENGSIFLTLFREYSNSLQKIRKIDEPIGLGVYDFAEVVALREDGTLCEPMELGRLVVMSPLTMKEYYKNPEATAKFFVKDANGKIWANLNCYGYIDKYNRVYLKGRVSAKDPEIKNFQIQNEIEKDTKNIMSVEPINFVNDDGEDIYVIHVEFQDKKINIEKVLKSAEDRCVAKFGERIRGKLYFRIRSFEEGFPTLFTAKRNSIELREEGINDNCIVPSIYYHEAEEKRAILKK